MIGRNQWIYIDCIIPPRYQPDTVALFPYPQHPMGYVYVVPLESDNVPNGESPGIESLYVNGIPFLDQGAHALSGHLQCDPLTLTELSQDQIVDYFSVPKISHSGLRHYVSW